MAESIVLSVTDSRSNSDIISLAEVKNYLRVTNTQDDIEIQDMIDNSIDAIERYLEQDILAKDRRMYLESSDDPFKLFYAPLGSVGVSEVVVDGETLSEGSYELLGIEDPSVRFNGSTVRNVNIRYTTKGITDLSKVKQGIKARCAWLYFGRDAKMSTNWKAFLSPYKRYAYYGTR